MVTGSRGFIGQHLCRELEARGWLVLPVHRGGSPGEYTAPPSSSPIEILVHLAFPTDHAWRASRPLDAFLEASRGTTAVVELALRAGVEHLVLASSGKVYGAPSRIPTSERHPIAPNTVLGKLKALTEQVAAAAAASVPLRVTSLRLFNVFGEGQAQSFLVPKLVHATRSGVELTLGELDHRRDWVHVEDVVRAFVAVMERPPPPCGELFPMNIGSGRPASVRDMLAILERATGRRPSWRQHPDLLRPGEAPEECADISVAAARLGWSPRISLGEGFERLLRAESTGPREAYGSSAEARDDAHPPSQARSGSEKTT
jgi:nucleoside-diphosphate-sugar epimerase